MLLAVKVLLLATVKVPLEEVKMSPLMEVARAAPKVGVTNVGEVASTIEPEPVEVFPSNVTVPEASGIVMVRVPPVEAPVILKLLVAGVPEVPEKYTSFQGNDEEPRSAVPAEPVTNVPTLIVPVVDKFLLPRSTAAVAPLYGTGEETEQFASPTEHEGFKVSPGAYWLPGGVANAYSAPEKSPANTNPNMIDAKKDFTEDCFCMAADLIIRIGTFSAFSCIPIRLFYHVKNLSTI